MHTFFRSVLALVVGCAALSAHAGWDLEQLMQALARNTSGRATFTEQKFIALLDKPVLSSGELLYTAPDRLEKRTLKPKPETMVLDHDTVTVERGKRQYVLRVKDYPELGVFVESIRGTLAGDKAALERLYQLTLDGNEAHWTLVLRPLNPKMLAVVQRITMQGERAELRSIEVEQADKDRSVMLIDNAAAP
ncbi:MAG: LolA-related protein [Rhodoferax sp.]|uniref:LolA-related protein n=2 Tax=Rhodoferax sp. TaxID=50421 RepID=UPI0032643C2F